MSRYAKLVSTGLHLPEREISNDLLRERFPEPPEFVDKMEASTGIRRRFWAPDDWATSDLALGAARQALEAAGRRSSPSSAERMPATPRNQTGGMRAICRR